MDMDNTEMMAADIALTMNGGEWTDGKWYSKGHREAWIKAVKPYADEIERLRQRDGFIAVLDKQIVEKDAEIERLREALAKVNHAVEKYADEKRFSQMTTLGTVQSIARSALQQKDSEK